MPPPRGRSSSSFERGGRDGPQPTNDRRPNEHSDQQYEGMFKGMGATSKEPVCSKRNSSIKRLHFATHFAVGCKQWDDPAARGPSVSQATFADPEVTYATRDCPDKNASVVELRQVEHDPSSHYRTEQRQRFANQGGPQPRDLPFMYAGQIHLGNDRPELITQTGATHHRPADPEAQRAAAFRSAGAGTLIPTSIFPKPERVNPITGGPRAVDAHDLGVMNQKQWGRLSANSSNIIYEHNVRDPVLGHHIPAAAYHEHSRAMGMKTTTEVIAEANTQIPHLRSLAALRPRS